MQKIAIVHDYLKEYGGAERVVETLLEIWPNADIYTSVFLPEYAGPHRTRIEKWKVHTSVLQYVPFKAKLISMFRFVAPLVFKSFNLSDYDVVITSTAGTYTSPNFVKIGKKTKLICYCHTPPRYLYGYPVANDWTTNWWRRILLVMGKIPMYFLKKLDFKASQLPDYFIANSKEVAGRIKKFYKRDAIVIYPPVEIPNLAKGKVTKDYYLAGGRLARAKRTDLAIKVCNKLRLPLKVFGRGFGGYAGYLKSIFGPTIEFLGEATEEQKWELYQNAKAYIYPSEKEDFGIQPVEAMAAGTPVIAYRSGGTQESVIDGKTGVFFNELTVESLSKAIKHFDHSNGRSITAENCTNQAKKFSSGRFKKEMLQFVNTHA